MQVAATPLVVDQSLAEGFVTEDLANGGTAQKTSAVGDYLVDLIKKA